MPVGVSASLARSSVTFGLVATISPILSYLHTQQTLSGHHSQDEPPITKPRRSFVRSEHRREVEPLAPRRCRSETKRHGSGAPTLSLSMRARQIRIRLRSSRCLQRFGQRPSDARQLQVHDCRKR
jgi:hypothetical protein